MKKTLFLSFCFVWFLTLLPSLGAEDMFYDDLPKITIANGVQKDYYDTGKLKMTSEVAGGKRHGITKVYDQKGRVKILYRFKRGKFMEAFEEAIKRDYGPFAIFVSFKFWAVGAVLAAGLWFTATKLLFKKRPF